MVARTVWSMPSICTRNIVLGSDSTISPSTSIFSSFWAIYLTEAALAERGWGHGKTRLSPRLRMVAKRGCPESALDQPFSALLHDLSIQFEPPALAQVLDDVPVHLADVLAADLGEAVAQRQVDGAVDLLVEERVLHVPRDARVAADSELAEPPGALVAVADLAQE